MNEGSRLQISVEKCSVEVIFNKVSRPLCKVRQSDRLVEGLLTQ